MKLRLSILVFFSLGLAPQAKAIGREPVVIGVGVVSFALVGLLVHRALNGEPERQTANYDLSRTDGELRTLRKLEDLSPHESGHHLFGNMSGAELDTRLKALEKNPPPSAFATSLLSHLQAEQTRRKEHRLFDPSVSLGVSYSQSPDRLNPNTEFYVNPLLNNREGMFLRDGGNIWAGPLVRGDAFAGFSYELEPLAIANSNGASASRVFFRRANGKFTYKNLELKAGISPVSFGFGRYSNMALSGNAEPFPMIRLANSTADTLPSFLEGLGPTRFQLFMGKLEANREFPNAGIEGLEMSFLPTPRFEAAFYYHFFFGGEGSNSGPLSPFGKDLTDAKVSRNFGVNLRYRIPGIELEPYVELHAEDCCGPKYVAWNTKDVLSLCGLYFPKLDSDGRWDLALEWARTNYISYVHFSYTSGFKYRKNVFGHPLGTDGDGVYAILRYFASPTRTGKLTVAYEIRRPALLAQPNETHYRVESQWAQDLAPFLTLSTELGLERAQDFGFIPGNGINNYFAGFTLTAH